jgi:hypothetical protein
MESIEEEVAYERESIETDKPQRRMAHFVERIGIGLGESVRLFSVNVNVSDCFRPQ